MNIFGVKYAQFLDWKRTMEKKRRYLALMVEGTTFAFMLYLATWGTISVALNEGFGAGNVVLSFALSMVIGGFFTGLSWHHDKHR